MRRVDSLPHPKLLQYQSYQIHREAEKIIHNGKQIGKGGSPLRKPTHQASDAQQLHQHHRNRSQNHPIGLQGRNQARHGAPTDSRSIRSAPSTWRTGRRSVVVFSSQNPTTRRPTSPSRLPSPSPRSAVVEEGETEKHWLYGNKELQQQQPPSTRRGKNTDKGSAVFGDGSAKLPWSNMRFR